MKSDLTTTLNIKSSAGRDEQGVEGVQGRHQSVLPHLRVEEFGAVVVLIDRLANAKSKTLQREHAKHHIAVEHIQLDLRSANPIKRLQQRERQTERAFSYEIDSKQLLLLHTALSPSAFSRVLISGTVGVTFAIS